MTERSSRRGGATTVVALVTAVVLGLGLVAGVTWLTAPPDNQAPRRTASAPRDVARPVATTTPAATPSPTQAPAQTSTSAPAPTRRRCDRPGRPFAPTAIGVPGVTSGAGVVTPPARRRRRPRRRAADQRRQVRLRLGPRARHPARRPRGNVLLNAHTWPDGSALGNRLLAGLQRGDRIVVHGGKCAALLPGHGAGRGPRLGRAAALLRQGTARRSWRSSCAPGAGSVRACGRSGPSGSPRQRRDRRPAIYPSRRAGLASVGRSPRG